MCLFDKTNNSMIVRNYATLDYNRDVNNVLKFFFLFLSSFYVLDVLALFSNIFLQLWTAAYCHSVDRTASPLWHVANSSVTSQRCITDSVLDPGTGTLTTSSSHAAHPLSQTRLDPLGL